MDTLTIDGESYLSSKRAAKITGYAKDYVGQLCREGRIDAKLVGRNWYVREQSIREHRFGQDDNTHDVNKSASKTNKSADLSPASSIHYTSEKITPLPNIKAEQNSAQEKAASLKHNLEHENIHYVAAMQKAWQEWFTKVHEVEPPRTDSEEDAQIDTGDIAATSYRAERFIEEDLLENTDEQVDGVSVRRIRNDPLPPPTEFTDITPPQEDEFVTLPAAQQAYYEEHFEEIEDTAGTSRTRLIARFVNTALMLVALVAFLLLTANFVYNNGKSGLTFITGTSIYTAK